MQKIERTQLAQAQISGGCCKTSNASTSTASTGGTANSTTIINEKIIIRLF